MKRYITKLLAGENLSREEAREAMDLVLDNGATPAQISAYLVLLRAKGETVDEISGSADMMKEKALHIHPMRGDYVDLVGTGGDGANTFNISTTAAFVAAGAGAPVAKHGNRAISSKSGSTDVLEALGVEVNLSPEEVERCINEIGIGFMFARSFHPKMKTVAGVRQELGQRTLFNILGPISNPSDAKYQALGIFNADLTEPIAKAMLDMGVVRGMTFNCDGVDELTTAGVNRISEIANGSVKTYETTAEDYGLTAACFDDLAGGTAQENAGITREILAGEKSPRRDTVLLNAAAALYIQGTASDMIDGVKRAAEAIDSGAAAQKLADLAALTQTIRQEKQGA